MTSVTQYEQFSHFTHASGRPVRTLTEAFQETIRLWPDRVALRTTGPGAQEITWTEYGRRVQRIAAGLTALGVTVGDTVAIMLTNRPEFHLVDTAVLHLGAIPFSIYNTNSPKQIRYLFGNAENRIVVTEQAFIRRIMESGVAPNCIVCVDGRASGTLTLTELEEYPEPDFDFHTAWTEVYPDDLATIIYTSGTTGPPKGVELTHANILSQLVGLAGYLPVGPDDRIISYLPAAHIADRVTAHYAGIVRGIQVISVADPRDMAAAMPETHPTVLFGVPRVWQKIRAGIENRLAAEPNPIKRTVARWAFDTAQRAARAQLEGRGRGLAHRVADVLVLSKVRHALGLDQVRHTASGAAPIPAELLEYFLGLGFRIIEVWGLSEATGTTTTTTVTDLVLGTVGKPLANAEVKVGADGEIFVRGPMVMRGYRKEPRKTAEVIDAAGWLATGDLATIDDQGNLIIVDRKSEMMITEAGKNIAPSNIENAVRAESYLIGQVMAIGDRRPYITALVVLDVEAIEAEAETLGVEAADVATLVQRESIRNQVEAAIRAGNTGLSRPEQIKRFLLLDTAWEPNGDELTPKMSLRRRVILEKYAYEIENLYADPPGPGVVDLGEHFLSK